MKVTELSREQLAELKQNYLCEICDRRTDETPSYGELAAADATVTDEEVFRYYAGVEFTADDFTTTDPDALPWWERE